MTEFLKEDDGRTLVIRRKMAAPRAALWACWTQVDLFRQWFCPRPWRVSHADLDPRPGGRMNCVMEGPDGERHDNIGCFLDVVPGYSFITTDAFSEGFHPRAESFMTGFTIFEDLPGGGTLMTWGARHATLAQAQSHLDMGFEKGWSVCAEQLDALALGLGKDMIAPQDGVSR